MLRDSRQRSAGAPRTPERGRPAGRGDAGGGGTGAGPPSATQRLLASLRAESLGVPCPPGAAALVLAVVVLSIGDAFLTLRLLLLGAVEVNPVMSALMEQGVRTFVNGKLLITSSAALFLLTVYEVRLFRGPTVRRILEGLVAGYALLVVYESAMVIALH